MLEAIKTRLAVFCSMGCKFSDVGVEGFPSFTNREKEFECEPTPPPTRRERAEHAFKLILKDDIVYEEDEDVLREDLYVFLAAEYAARDMVMQLHLCVTRNSNYEMLRKCGRDAGFDCVGENIEIRRLRQFLNEATYDGEPYTIVYSLNPTLYYELITLCGAFQAEAYEAVYGGGEANVAVSLAQLGADAAFITRLPENAIADKCIKELRGWGVDTSRILRGGDRWAFTFAKRARECARATSSTTGRIPQ